MLTEPATVVSVDTDGIWVEARAKSQCGSCQARKGCGHSLLDAFFVRANHLRAWSDDRHLLDSLVPGDRVTIGVPEQTVLVGSLILYLFPLLTMTLPALVSGLAGAPEGVVILAAAAGLGLGLFLLQRGGHHWLVPPRAQLLARVGSESQPLTIQRTAQ